MIIEVYTDGSATRRDKPGGWAYVLIFDGKKHAECAGHMAGASNNDAEMEAAIQGLAATLKYVNEQNKNMETNQDRRHVEPDVTLVSDSQLVLGWASGSFGFHQTERMEKYKQLQFLVHRLGAKTRHVRGHTGDEHNERCDKLANEARLGVNRNKDKADAILSGSTLIGTKKSGVVCLWYKNSLKVVDLETNVIEDYKRSIHGPRGGFLEVREDKSR